MAEAESPSTLHGTLAGDPGRPRAELLFVAVLFAVVRLVLGVVGFPLAGAVATVAALVAIAVLDERGLAIPLGLRRPDSWLSAVFWGMVALASTVVVGLVVLPELLSLLPESLTFGGRLASVRNSPVGLVLTLVLVGWLATAFGEEVFWRGFVLPRLAAVLGDSLLAWIAAVAIQALAFGLLHAGGAHQIAAAILGLVYGLVYWLGGRNLWPLVAVHAIAETVSLLGLS